MIKTLLILLTLASGEFERVEVAAAKVRAAQSKQAVLPDTAPNIKLPNVIGDTRLKLTAAGPEVNEVYDVYLHCTTGCPPCDQLEKGLATIKEFNVIKKLNYIPPDVPTQTFPFITFYNTKDKLLYSFERDPKKLLDIVRYSGKVKNTRYLTSEELKDFASTYTGQIVGVRGMTVKQHLMDANHRFLSEQLTNLCEKELLAVHSGHHYNLISPTKSEEEGFGARQGKAVGSINARPQVEQLFNYIKTYVGENKPIYIEWYRTGPQSISLLKRQTKFNSKLVFGNFGRFELRAENPINLPVSQAGFGYRIVGDDVVIDADAITIKGLANFDNTDVSVSQQAMGIDPASILTIFSIIRGIYLLVNPEMDLHLGGNVKIITVLNGDVLTVTFEEGPEIQITSIMRFKLGLSSVVIDPQNVRFNYSGSRWYKFTDFKIE